MGCQISYYIQYSKQLTTLIMTIIDKVSPQLINALNPSWTQLVLILSLVFRKDVAGLLRRIKKISPNGISLGNPKQDIPPETPINNLLKKDESIKTFMPTVQRNIDFIDTYMQKNITSDNARKIDFLKNEIAQTYFSLRCERIYYLIYGSQITLLKLFRSNEQKFLKDTEVSSYYLNNVKKTHSEFYNNFDLNSYLYFLIQTQLISSQESGYYLSEFGNDFLTWLHLTGYPENRFF